jgi:WD40 repeat protein
LADDLARFLCGESVRARPVSGVTHGWRWMRRRPALTFALLALLLSLLIGTGLVLRKARENQRQATAIRQLSHTLRSESYANGIQAATLEWRQGNPAMAETLLAKNPGPADPEFRDFTARWLTEQIQDRSLVVLPGRHGMVLSTRFSHDGRWLAAGSQGGVCQIWEVATRRLHREWNLPGQAFSIDFSPDDTQLYIGTGGQGEVRGVGVWQRETGEKSAEFPGGMGSLSADGSRLATVVTDFYPYWQMAGPVRVWEVAGQRLLGEWPGNYRSTAISPDGKEVAMTTRDGQVSVADIATRTLRPEQKLSGAPRGLRYSPDGRWLAAWCSAEAKIPDAVIMDRRGEQAPAWMNHPQQLASFAFSRDSRHGMTAGSDYSIRHWSLAGLEDPATRLLGSQDEVWSLDFHPQQPLLVSGNKAGDLTLWSTLEAPAAAALIPHSSYERPTFSADGQLIATQETMTSHIIRDVTSGEVRHRLPLGFAPIHLGAGAREIIGFAAASSRLIWWDTARAAEVKSYPCPGLAGVIFPHLLIRITPDGEQWLVIDSPTRVGLHRSADGSLITSWTVPEMRGQIERDAHLALSRDGRCAAWHPPGSHTAWLLPQDSAPLALVGHSLGLSRMEFSPDGQTLATSSVDHTIRFWDARSGKCTATLAGHFEEVSDICFSPDGRTLGSIALGDSVKFWQFPSGRELLRIEDSSGGAHLVFSPNGQKLAVNSDWKFPHGPSRGLKIFQVP